MRGRLFFGSAWAAVLVALALAGVARADFTISEGQSFSGKVVDIGSSCVLGSATIYWGDGTPTSPGTSDGGTGVKGTHTYADERASPAAGNVSYTCSNFRTQPPPIDFQATVRDAPLTGAGRDVSGTSGQPLSGVVAHFSDANPGAGAGDFSARITWGDGSSTFGTVVAAPGGGFDVSGTHTYATPGSYAVSTAVTDAGGSTAGASSAAQISSPAPPPPPPPTAHFTFSPASPCRDEFVYFDASSSTEGGNPIKQYRWSFSNVLDGQAPETFDTPLSAYRRRFGEWTGRSKDTGPDHQFFFLYLFRPPVRATLTVVDSAKRTDTTSQMIAFADPVESLEFAPKPGLSGLLFGGWFVVSPDTPCDTRLKAQHDQWLGVGLAVLVVHSASLDKNKRSVAVTIPCSDPKADCYGVLALQTPTRPTRRPVQARTAARRARADKRTLGLTTFVVPAGHKATVKVKLNQRGRRLVRAHKLRTVTVRLGAFRPKGKILVKTRTVRLRQRH